MKVQLLDNKGNILWEKLLTASKAGAYQSGALVIVDHLDMDALKEMIVQEALTYLQELENRA